MSASRTRRTGPGALKASIEARRRATVILETLTGLLTPQEAAEVLGVAPARYYQLETYALQGLVEALEPRARGRQLTSDRELELVRADVARLEREVKRHQALYRTTQRALGLPPAKSASSATSKSGANKSKSKSKTVRRRRKTSRGEQIAAKLGAQVKAGAPVAAPNADASQEKTS